MLDYVEAAASRKRGKDAATLRKLVERTRGVATRAAAHCDGQDPIALSVEDLKALARARGAAPPNGSGRTRASRNQDPDASETLEPEVGQAGNRAGLS